jgi:protein O-mannosyl-transferase
MSGQVRKKQRSLPYLLPILLLTVLVFSNSLKNDFIPELDDDIYVTENPMIRDLSVSGLKNIFSSFVAGNYHPLTMLSLALDYRIFGLNASGFHTTNLLLHLLNTALVFILIGRLASDSRVAALVALFFAVHPMHVESVSWISERKDVLYALFFLGALLSYVLYLQRNRSRKYWNFCLLLFLGSLLSKPMAVTLPAVLLLLDFFHNRKLSWKTLVEKTPFFLLSLVFGVLTLVSQQPEAGIRQLAATYSVLDRFLIPARAVVFYLVKLFVPTNLSAFHYYPDKADGRLPFEFYLAPVILAAAFLVFRIVVKSDKDLRRDVVFGMLFFLFTISIVLQIIPAGRAYAAERYTYIPYIGLFFIPARVTVRFLDSPSKKSGLRKAVAAGVIILTASAFSVQSFRRNRVWQDGLRLFTDVIEKHPRAGHGYFIRGIFKHNRLRDYAGALDDYNKAASLRYRDPHLYANRAGVRGIRGDYEGALADSNRAIDLNPDFDRAYFNRGTAKYFLKDMEGAAKDFSEAFRLNPANGNAAFMLGNAFFALEDRSQACESWRKAFALGHAQARDMLGTHCAPQR